MADKKAWVDEWPGVLPFEGGTTIGSDGRGKPPPSPPKGTLEQWEDDQKKKRDKKDGDGNSGTDTGGDEGGTVKKKGGLAGTMPGPVPLTPEEMRRRAALMQQMVDAQGANLHSSISSRDDAGNVLPAWLMETMRKNR